MTENQATPSLLNESEDDYLPSQAELYDDLKRIGELEDEKRDLQSEIDHRTNRLREAIVHLDKSSLLFKMLNAALGTPKKPAAKKTTAKKSASTRSTKRR